MISGIMDKIDQAVRDVLQRHASAPWFDKTGPHIYVLIGARIATEHALNVAQAIAKRLP